ncbi:MAG TPA: AMIN domain-containing protein [Terriglobales bacterium]|nr:AMIN domain-containing protein [Terriglobales bacterium]
MSVRMVQEKNGPAVEILSTKPLVPSIQAISDPDRLVIDLPNARLEKQKRISVQADQISSIRADQFQQNPPVARLVVDLLEPRAYTWDAAGNRLVVHLGNNPNQTNSSPFQPSTVPSLMPAPQPVVAAVRAAGPLALAENDGGAGSSITAGPDTAVLNLSSGGEVHVCPGTSVSVTPSQNRHNLMLSMNTGALEAHFALDASSDSVMTPDFRILLVGPGEFHYAISRQSGQYLRAGAARQHGIGDCYRTARQSHVPGQGNRPARVSFRATRSCGYGGAVGVRMSATAGSPAAGDKQSAHAEPSAGPSSAVPERKRRYRCGDGSPGKHALDGSAGSGRST